MTSPVIETPRGGIVITKSGKASLVWNTEFKPKRQKDFKKAQKFVDSEVLRYSEPYIPLLTGMLIKSGILGTYIGSGEVAWIAPYSKAQYYNKRPIGRQTGELRGGFWFQRMKETHWQAILEGARKIAGRQKL
jgi:hypothetical protein